jgi:hypothetical protein
MTSELYKWIPMKRGDTLPDNAVYSGQTSTDAKVYIAKIDNSPGKVNLDNGKIYNFWSQKYNSRTEGEVLVSYGVNSWKELKYGETIPVGAVLGGRDYNSDKVWVGKDITTDEPGKITCLNENATNPSMCRLWCHTYWCTADVKIANILIIKSKPKPIIEQKSKSKPIIIKQKDDSNWGQTLQYKKISECIKTKSVDISVSNIVSAITKTIAIVSGELSHIGDLLKTDIKANISTTQVDSEEANESVVNDENKKNYILLKYYKKTLKKKGGIKGVFNYNTSDYNLIIEYAIFQPENNASREKCEKFKRKLADKIMGRF